MDAVVQGAIAFSHAVLKLIIGWTFVTSMVALIEKGVLEPSLFMSV